jgi:polyhydroxyalkanoate synthesis regulator phasin
MMALTAAQKKAERIAAADAASTAAFQASIPQTIEEPLSQAELNDLTREGKTSAEEAERLADEADALVEKGRVLTPEEIQKYIQQYTKESIAAMNEQQKTEERLSAFNILRMEFEQYGLGSLVDSISNLLTDGTPPSEFGLRLRGTKAYQDRFKGNEARIAAGLSALSPAEYVALEDQYQNIMRNAGLPSSYYTKDKTGKQPGFEKFIGGDVSALELQDRISTAQSRVINANPEVTSALKQFYPDITDGDILAYTLDPAQGLESIKRKVTAAEIGGAALSQTGLTTSLARAEQLQRYGVDKVAATSGYSTIGAGLQRGSQLAAIYEESPYTQATAEEEIFNIPGAAKAREKRQKITGLEKATFGGQSGISSGALARDRAGGY